MIDALDIQINKVEKSRINEVDPNNIPFGKICSDHMFLADYEDGEWKNLRIEPYAYLRLSPSTAAIHYGQSIFEGMKAFKNENGEPMLFRPKKNLKRFNRSAERMCMPAVPEEIFMGGLTELIRLDANWIPDRDGTSMYVRPFMFAADEYIGVRPSNTYKFMIFTCPVGAYYTEPVKVKIETKYARAFEGGTGFAKAAGNYASSLYPAQLAQKEGYHQLIWTDGKTHSYIEESGTMNIMFIIKDKLITPAVSDTILEGITRDSILQVARDWGMALEERKITVQEILEAIQNETIQEAFGVGTAVTVAHVSLIGYNGENFKLPVPGKENFSVRVLNYLERLKRGKEEDKFGWMYKI